MVAIVRREYEFADRLYQHAKAHGASFNELEVARISERRETARSLLELMEEEARRG
jgi:hypothetical protein